MCDCSSCCKLKGEPGARGPQGFSGPSTNGTNGTNAFKYVDMLESSGGGEVATILYSDIINCGNIPSGCIGAKAVVPYKLDYTIEAWVNTAQDVWINVRNSGSLFVLDYSINSLTGDLSVAFNFAPLPDLMYFRIIISG